MATEAILLREYDPAQDYAAVSAWWAAHGWTAVPQVVLPRLGVIAQAGGTDLAAAWLYMDNSVGVCWLEWLVTSPACTGRTSLRAIRVITEFLQGRAREMNYFIMMTMTHQPSLVRVHEQNGFTRTDEGMTHLIARLKAEEEAPRAEARFV